MAEISKESLHLDKPDDHNSMDISHKKPAQSAIVPKDSVKVHHKSLMRRFMEDIIEADAQTVKEYVIREVVIPGLKDILTDAVKDGVDVLFNGIDSRGRSSKRGRSGSMSNPARTSYGSFYTGSSLSSMNLDTYNHPARSLDDITLRNRQLAETVLRDLQMYLDKYGSVPVTKLYDDIDMSCPWTYERYGWYDLEGAGYRHVRDGYLLMLPRPVVLDRN